MPELRQELINSAVTFLRDPQVAGSSLAKRIEFLESKELTNEEIQEALRRAGSDTSMSTQSGQYSQNTQNAYNSQNNNYNTRNSPSAHDNYNSNSQPGSPPFGYASYNAPPPVPQRDWRDYFVMATVTAGIGYGIYELLRRYVLPQIVPPTQTALDADKEALEAEFARAQATLDQIQENSKALKESDELRTQKVDEALQKLERVVSEVRVQVEKRDEEMKLVKLQIEKVKNEIPEALEKNSTAQQASLDELLTELQALKQLVSTRMKGGQASIPPPPMPTKNLSSISSLGFNKDKAGSIPNTNPPPSVFNNSKGTFASTSSSSSNPEPVSVSEPSSSSSFVSQANTSSTAAATSSSSSPPQAGQDASSSQPANDIFASMPSFNRARNGIPAWQLAKNKAEPSSSSSDPAVASSSPSDPAATDDATTSSS